MMSVLMCFLLGLMGVFMGASWSPFMLGGVVFISSIILSLLVSLKVSVFYGVILFLIMVGGLMVAFAYTVSLIPNPFFNLNSNFSLGHKVGTMLLVLVLLSILFMFYLLVQFPFFQEFIHSFQVGESIYSVSWGVLLFALGILLLEVMIGVVVMCFKFGGALMDSKVFGSGL